MEAILARIRELHEANPSQDHVTMADYQAFTVGKNRGNTLHASGREHDDLIRAGVLKPDQ